MSPDRVRRLAIATCARWPELTASDALLVDELHADGCEVRVLPWNDADAADFDWADAVVLRSTWDYHHDLAGYDRWLVAREQAGQQLHNHVDLVRWSLDKRNLFDLASSGLRFPSTVDLTRVDAVQAMAWAGSHGFEQLVVKPAWGASGHAVKRIERDELGDRWFDLHEAADGRPLLLQEYLPGITEGEQSLVYLGGEFSHAVVKRPHPSDFRVNGQYGGRTELVEDPSPTLIEFGLKVNALLPRAATYVRIDVVPDRHGGADEYALLEVEVNEPGLGLHLAPGSARRFADAILA
ncbi:MAG: hypothetical protein AAGA93_08875 [Actinomycetota bacterium]